MSAIFVVIAKVCLSFAFASGTEVPVGPGDRLVIKGLDAQVILSGTGSGSLKISGIEDSGAIGAYSLVRKENVIEIQMKEFSNLKSWFDLLSKSNLNSKKIEISGASVPVEINLKSGNIVAQKWQRELRVTMTDGKVNLSNGNGEIRAYLQKGEIGITDHLGKVTVDTFSGGVNLKNIQGDVDLSLFTGQLVLDRVKGFSIINTTQAQGKVLQSSGTVQFENGKGNLMFQNFQGRVEGQTLEGGVTISAVADSEVDIKSKSGKISVQIPSSVGAVLNLLTTEGEIIVPSELRVTKIGSEKSVRGRLRGDAQKINVSVRSQDGLISVK
jgi:DUF4097 and DUF4098 domain-containing protein YvlB